MSVSAISLEESRFLSAKGGGYLVEYTFPLARWDEFNRESMQAFWRSRWFRLKSDPQGAVWHGTRGSVVGNLFAFDVRKRISEILLTVGPDFIACRLLLDFRYQMVTEWDIMDHKLELVMFRAVLEGRALPDYFKELSSIRNAAHAKWLVTGLFGTGHGETAPSTYHEELWRLAGDSLPHMMRRVL